MPEWRGILLFVHLMSTLAMAAPLYMLIIVNERVRFGAPLGHFTVHFSVQPRIESLVNQLKPEGPAPRGLGPQIAPLRLRRKRLSAFCLFLVLTALAMGLRATFDYNLYLALLFVAAGALYAWRAYRKPLPLGWI